MLYKDIKTVYNSFSNGGKAVNKYDGRTQSSGQMYRMKVNGDTVRPESITHDSTGYTYNLPEYVVTPQSNPDNGSRRVITLEEMAQQAAMNKAINEGMNRAGNIGFEAAMLASMFPAAISAPAATGMGLLGGAAGNSTGAKIGEYLAGDEGAVYGGLVGGLIGGGLGAGVTSSRIRSLMNSPHTGKWTKFGNKEYRLDPNSLGADGLPIQARVTELSKAQIDNGWTIDSDGFAVNPKIKGKRFVKNAEGKLISEDAYQQELHAKNLNKQSLNIEKENLRNSERNRKKASTLYDKLDDIGIRDLREELWFKDRPSSGPGAVTEEDLNIWRSHIPEYFDKAKTLVKDGSLYQKEGKWYGKFTDGDIEVNPSEYIVAHSDAFKRANLHYDGRKRFSGMSSENYRRLIDNGGKGSVQWNTDNYNYADEIRKNVDPTSGKVIEGIVAPNDKIHIAETKSNYPKPLSYTETGKPAGKIIKEDYGEKGIVDFPEIYTDIGMGRPESWRVFGKDIPVKVLRGNNGNFDMMKRNIYKGIVPVGIGLTAFEASE